MFLTTELSLQPPKLDFLTFGVSPPNQHLMQLYNFFPIRSPMCPLAYKVLLRNIKERSALQIFLSETPSFNLMKYVKDYMKLGM